MIDKNRQTSSTSVLREMTEIWKRHLDIETLDPTTSFESLGGHSLHAVRIVSEIANTFGLDAENQQRLLEFDTIQRQMEFVASLDRR